MSNTPLGNLLSGLNNALDGRIAGAIGLRRLLERASYRSAYYGVKLASRASSTFKSNGKQKSSARLKSGARKDLFDLNLTEEQSMIRDAIGDFVNQQIRPNAEHCSEEGKISEEIFKSFNELGLSYYAVPEEMGGMLTDKCTVTQMVITESLANGDLGMALGLLTPLGVLNALVRYGSAEQQGKYIPPFLEEGSRISASIAVNEPVALFDPFQLETEAANSGDGYVLSGNKSMIPMSDAASFYLIAANADGGQKVFIVNADAKGVSLKTDRAMGLRSAGLGQLDLKDVKVGSDAVLLEGDDYAEYIHLIQLSWCALAVGTCQSLLDYVIEYCNSREAFGEPITHRQAVAFMIADIKIELEGMRILMQRAASRAEQGLDFGKEAYLASTFCSEKAMTLGNDGVQLLGGYGYCRDYPVERWYRDLRAVALSYNGMHL